MKRLFTLLALLAMFSLTSCEILGGDNITPDNNQTEQPDNGDENKNPDNGDENQDPDNPTQHKIYVYNAIGWEPLYIYMWRWEGEQVTEYVGAWCGAIVEQTEVINGHTYYVYDLPTDANGKEIGVIFNDSNGTQTSDWYITIDKDYYILLSEATTPSIIEDKNNPTGGNNNDDPVTPPVDEVPETQKIYYTSTDGGIVEPNNEGVDYFGANIISNTYENGKGVITFDGDVTLIGEGAFYECTSLASVILPNGITSIVGQAFSFCYRLTSVTIPDSVTSIGDNTFLNCKNLSSITIPNGVTTIGYQAFAACSSLTSITIPDSVTSIGEAAYRDCSNLTNVTIGKGVSNIGSSTFSNCVINDLTIKGKFIENDHMHNDEICRRWFHGVTVKNVFIGDNITRLGNYALGEYSNPNALIREACFLNIVIPDSVTEIGENTFSWCKNLLEITIPDSVTSIGASAFYECSGLTSINIPDGIISIEDSTFASCSSLASIAIPDSVTSIGASAFYECSGLTNITIPEGVTSIGESAFAFCNSLASVTIPDSITSIGMSAFQGCNIEEVHITDLKAWCKIPFDELGYTNPLNNEAANLYLNGELIRNLTIPEGVAEIKTGAFSGCKSIESVTFPDSVTSIGQESFQGCESLTNITIGSGVSSIGFEAFHSCTNLESIIIPDNVTEIGAGAFGECTSLKSVRISDNVTEIQRHTFSDCSSLTTLTIGRKVKTIEEFACWRCPSLAEVYLKPIYPPYIMGFGVFSEATPTIYVPMGSVDLYITDLYWGQFTIRGCYFD